MIRARILRLLPVPVGWLLCLGLLALRHRVIDALSLVAVILVAACALQLSRQREFPRRAEGLATSWIGPFLILATSVTLRDWVEGGDPGVVAHGTGLVIRTAVLRGIGGMLVMLWLFRGYGLIPLLASLAAILPGRASKLREEARGYPWRLWWLGPVLVAVLAGMHLLVYCVILARA